MTVFRRRRTPTILQMEASDCGAACLGIICAYWQRWLALKELREMCHVSRDGTPATSLIKAAGALGLEVHTKRITAETLHHVPHPMIVPWQLNQFVVLERITRKKAWINDPATGPRVITRQEFDDSCNDVMLDMVPGAGFRHGGRPPRLMRGVLRRIQGQTAAFAFTIFLAIGLIIPGLLVPLFTKIFIDQVLMTGHDRWLIPLLIIITLTGIVMAALTWLQREVLLRLETVIILRGSIDFARHILQLPLGYFAQRHPGEVASRVMLNDRVGQLIAGQIGVLILSAITALAYLLAMLAYAPFLTLPVILAASINFIAFVLISRQIQDTNRQVVGANAAQTGFAKTGLQMIDAWAARGEQDLFRARLVNMQNRVSNLQQIAAMPQLWLSGLPALTGTLAAGAVLILGGRMVIAGQLSIGALIAFQGLMLAFFSPFSQLIKLSSGLLDGVAIMRLLDDTLDHPPADEFTTPATAITVTKLSGALKLQNLCYSYSPRHTTLNQISFQLAPGERLGIVGPSGSGKSTLGWLIARHITAHSGDILFDGNDINQIPRQILRQSLAHIDQHSFMFQGSIRENVTLWDSSLPEERVIEACQRACLHHDILQRPDGYNSVLLEGGRNLSGGQRARLEIARALVRDPRILILDEATAALDAQTEGQIMTHLAALGLSLIVIAHRYSALRHVDRVVVLQGGQIVQQGNPADLIQTPGPFRTLMEAEA